VEVASELVAELVGTELVAVRYWNSLESKTSLWRVSGAQSQFLVESIYAPLLH
jgi:hypothetical protein